nr:hypothetical protein [Bacillaceae bacterium]
MRFPEKNVPNILFPHSAKELFPRSLLLRAVSLFQKMPVLFRGRPFVFASFPEWANKSGRLDTASVIGNSG